MSKKSIWFFLLTLLLVMSVGTALAEKNDQVKGRLNKPTTTDYKIIDINEIECFVQNSGPLAENPATGGDGFFYPKGQRTTSIIYTAGLWVLGKIDGDIRSAACQYSTEYQPGSILPDGTASDATSPEFVVYKYNKNEPIDQIAIDQGCPDHVIGDQMTFCVYNDLGSHAGVYTKAPIGIEVQQVAFAFNRTGALGKTIFVRYRFINKNKDGKNLEDAYVGIFFDPDVGDGKDDATGCDPDLGIAYVYNGTNNDSKFGAGPPAVASDFFQGPIVDDSTSTAYLPDGRVLPGKRILSMTAYWASINTSPIPGMGDPTLESAYGAQEAYYYVSGYRANGQAWTDPQGNTTNFPISGDPVLGTGWLWRNITTPTDVRMGNASGPFLLANGDTQDVVIGLVVGDGPTNLSSVQLMQYNDAQAQSAYNLDFDLPSVPPEPIVTAIPTEGKIALTWDDGAVSFSEKGYNFEGFNIYMAESAAGPWTRVTTFDVENDFSVIWDEEFDVNLAAVINQPVQFGTNSGLQYHYFIEKDYINNTALVNAKPYYFAVSAYAYSETGVPRTLETAKKSYECSPQLPVLDEQYNSTQGQVIPFELHGPPAVSATCKVTVVDPSKILPHDYRVNLLGDDDNGYYWELVDVTTGETKMAHQTNLLDLKPLVLDGLFIEVYAVSPDAYGFDALRGKWGEEGDRYVGGVNFGGETMGGGLFLGENFWGNSLTRFDYCDVQVDFWNAEHNQADPVNYPWTNCQTQDRNQGYINNGIGTFPGAAYDVDDPDNPRRLNICFVESHYVDHHWNPLAAEDSSGIYQGGREYLFIMKSDYLEDPTTLYNDEYDFSGGSSDVLYVATLGHNATAPSDDSNDEWTWYIYAAHPYTPEVSYMTFSMVDYAIEKSADVAKDRLKDIGVFPNPYFGHNKAEGDFFTQFVTFCNLPADNCVIRIFSLSGALISTIEHSNGTPFEKWYLLNDEELPVASGMYIAHVETEFGDKILKLAVINREARYQHM